MSFANPWGLLALTALPAIAAIHLFHRRYPRMKVAGLHLWGVARMTHTPGRRRERLPITTTLILELLAALVLAMVLARPQVESFNRAVHLVVVLDSSASMSARRVTAAGVEKTFRELAVEELEKRVQSLPQGSMVTLIETGRRPILLYGPQKHYARATAALADWKPQGPRHDFQAAWDLADQLAESTGQLLFLTDTLPASGRANLPARLEVVSVGEPQPNLAIATARWSLNEDEGSTAGAGAGAGAENSSGGTVFLRLANLGLKTASATISGSVGGAESARLVFERTIEIEPGRTVPLQVEVPGGLGLLDISLTSDRDALELDSRVQLVEPKRRSVRLAMTLPADSVARRQVSRVLTALQGWQPSGPADADLVIAPAGAMFTGSAGGASGGAPGNSTDQWWLGIGPIDESDAVRKKAVDLSDRSAYVLEKRHPLLEGVLLDGVIWGGVQEIGFDHTPLVTAGSRMLLVQRLDTRSTAYVLNIDLARSNLPDTPDWPIFLSNLVEQCRDSRPGLRRSNYRVTEEIRFRVDEQAATGDDLLVLEGAGRQRQVARGRMVEVAGLTRAGLYTLKDGDRELARFAVNFQDAEESVLATLSAGHRSSSQPVTETGFRLDSPYTWLVLSGILIIITLALADWQILRTTPILNPTRTPNTL